MSDKTLPMPGAGEPITYNPPVPQRWSVDGIEIIFLENQELPFLNATLYFRNGSLNVPDIDPAVVSVAGQQMRAGGAGKWSADDLDEQLEVLSAGISSSLGEENGSVSVSGLVSDKEKLFELFEAVVKTPRFEERRLQIWKGKALESIRRRKEDPYTVASVSFNELLYPDTPYGYVLRSDTVHSIARVDLLRAHRALVRPEGALLAVTGAISREEVTALVQRHFADWKVADRSFSPVPEVKTVPRPGVFLIEMPFEQSTFIMGHLGVPRLSPQHIPIIVFNEVFGAGGFTVG
jgi:predicted Zn-dependent peptidase